MTSTTSTTKNSVTLEPKHTQIATTYEKTGDPDQRDGFNFNKLLSKKKSELLYNAQIKNAAGSKIKSKKKEEKYIFAYKKNLTLIETLLDEFYYTIQTFYASVAFTDFKMMEEYFANDFISLRKKMILLLEKISKYGLKNATRFNVVTYNKEKKVIP